MTVLAEARVSAQLRSPWTVPNSVVVPSASVIPIAVDFTALMGAGDTLASPSSACHDQDGNTVSLTDAATLPDSVSVQQIVRGAALQAGITYRLDVTVTLNTNKVVTAFVNVACPADPSVGPPVIPTRRLPYVPIARTSAYTAVASDLVLADASGGDFTVTLPPTSNGASIIVKNVGATGTVTVTGTGTELPVVIATQYQSFTFNSSSTAWWVT